MAELTDSPYLMIHNGRWFGYYVTIVDPRFPALSRSGRAMRISSSEYWSRTFGKAKAKGLRKLTKYERLREREICAWKVEP